MNELYKLTSEFQFVDLKEKYPIVFEVILAKLIEDEVAKERVRYGIDKEIEKLKEQNKQLKFQCESLLDACNYYLPILEDRLACGAYMRQKINFYNKFKNKLKDDND